ncbi:glycosyl transferase group 1 [Stanieria cyanosphaera PCC 7437]|uniref:Glycosyl transferase group 1 n=1 Tax=Stanieria cyanosphaera (strain ATCC 29371 / PCC 7437) TaxID=111780 RepID=K9XYN9_STAC7|nr:hormogonium polysaccharide biosynthesis glycosyltransferase HpsO [Stanieria cyanosphaera]AFZ37144.1 glycosyl transferase group 1 [Stanieria cyanosphaera PCC 7437]
MKILVASHTYIVDLNCEKLKELAKLKPEIQVTVIVPKFWQPGGVQNKLIETKPKIDKNFRVVPLQNFSQNNQGLLTFGKGISKLLKEFRPNIIQVEQGAKSLGYAQLITLNKLLKLKAKNVLFTWWNLPYQNKFPIDWLEKYNLQHTHGLIAGNQDGADILREHGYKNQVEIMPQLGVNERLFSARTQPELAAKLKIQSHEFVIGFVGRFVPEKGILTLIKALTSLTYLPWKLLLLGRGELKETIEQQAREAGIQDRLIIIESVPHDCVPDYINLMNVLVLPSETTYQFKTLTAAGWKEQFGHVLIEAMACQVPVIGSNSGEIPHVIGDAGLIFPEGDATALAHNLKQLIEQPDLCDRFSQMGYQRVITKYTNTALAKQQLEFYQQLLT